MKSPTLNVIMVDYIKDGFWGVTNGQLYKNDKPLFRSNQDLEFLVSSIEKYLDDTKMSEHCVIELSEMAHFMIFGE